MRTALQPPDVQRVLKPLKDFQRDTVDYVFRRLYTDPDAVDRFLIADEVGLGKTLVARGVVAQAVSHLWNTVKRIDVVYVCANHDIAQQNISRLNFTGERDLANASRLTLLPLTAGNLQDNKLNFVSFTPRTSFDLHSQSGIAQERALIYHMLRRGWQLGAAAGPRNLLQCNVERSTWQRILDAFDCSEIDPHLARQYIRDLSSGDVRLREQFDDLQRRFGHYRRHVPDADQRQRLRLIGDLRHALAKSCLEALEPDIVILDEFQRFKYLLHGTDEVAALARDLLKHTGVKVLLLSATPYKMYTMHHEQGTEEHYTDFLQTTGFLLGSEPATQPLKQSLDDYRLSLLQAGQDGDAAVAKVRRARDAIQGQLRRVMVRTERLRASERSNAMLEQCEDPLALTSTELDAFAHLDRVATALGASDPVEYWKSTPYVLSLMDQHGYKIKEELVKATKDGAKRELLQALPQGRELMLAWPDIRAYRQIDPNNARLRALLKRTVDTGAWQLLWVPPSLPYYEPSSGAFADWSASGFTKALVFSSWQVVPKAIAMMCSYEAERRMVATQAPGVSYERDHRKQRPLLRFALATLRTGPARMVGMSNFVLLYPCWALASRIDPLRLGTALAAGRKRADLTEMHAAVSKEVSKLIRPLLQKRASRGGRVDDRWYWAAMALLDRVHVGQRVGDWLANDQGDSVWRDMVEARSGDDDDSNFAEHVDLFCQYFQGEQPLGRPPTDLVDVLTKAALASPAIASLRALMRTVPQTERLNMSSALLAAASHVALGFRSLFNMPECIALVRSGSKHEDTRYWESVLDYCVAGNLQSVLDEYTHILRESLGLFDTVADEALPKLAAEMREALSLRTASLDFDEIRIGQLSHQIQLDTHSLRCMFALALRDTRDEIGQIARSEQVRSAFNSPFRPFVLATTSIGQEGLDFHQYCHAVYHWNLPSNPVDLEQREGRVHRYKCHAIRRNLSKEISFAVLRDRIGDLGDPWQALFRLACERRGRSESDLVPFWVYDVPGGHKVERHILALPLSRERERLPELLEGLVAYRMVLGQARQEDLVRYLLTFVGHDELLEQLLSLSIDLSPPKR